MPVRTFSSPSGNQRALEEASETLKGSSRPERVNRRVEGLSGLREVSPYLVSDSAVQ
jgi:hypothetical protein